MVCLNNKKLKSSKVTRDAFQYSNHIGPAPILDAMIALLEPPEYILYLGARDLAYSKLRNIRSDLTGVLRQKDFWDKSFNDIYTKQVGVVDIDNDYRYQQKTT